MNLKNSEQAVLALRNLYEQYGYLPFKMSRFEEYDLYVQNKDFLISDQVITFSDRNGRLLALKPDVTLSIIKNAIDNPGHIQKLYYNENVYRIDKGTQSFKEILQSGLECVGDLGEYEVAEVMLLAAKSLSIMGKSFVLDISHTGLVETVISQCAFSEAEHVQAITCLRQKNRNALAQICENCGQAEKLIALVNYNGTPEKVLSKIRSLMTDPCEIEAIDSLERVCRFLMRQGFEQNIRIDFSVGSDMNYYGGFVFKGYLEGVPTSILSGGQYDKLLRKMGKTSKAIGFAVYLDLLQRLDSATFDVDQVLLYDSLSDTGSLLTVAESLRNDGSLLVTTTPPLNRSWSKLYRYQDGEAVLIEKNG